MYNTHRSLHKFNLGFSILILVLLCSINYFALLNDGTNAQSRNNFNERAIGYQNENSDLLINYHSRNEITISINEIMANAENEDTGEFIELYNYGTSPINISGWYIQDPKDKNDRVIDYTGEFDVGLIGTVIPPEGFCIYVDSEYQGEYNSQLKNYSNLLKMIMVTCDSDTTIGNGLTNSQDTVIVNNSAGFQIERSWTKDAGNGRSMGLIPDGSGPWVVMQNPTPGYSNGGPPKVILNELMYNPKGKEADGEWVELYNADSVPVELSGWKLSDGDKNILLLPELEMPADSYLVVHVGRSPEQANGISQNNQFTNGAAHVYFNRTSSILTNTGDCLNLSTAGDLCVDYMAYGNRTSVPPPVWYLNWEGANLGTNEGSALALFPNGLVEDSNINWLEVSDEYITPGWNNEEVYRLDIIPDESVIQIETGNAHTVNITIINNGTVDSIFDIDITEPLPDWTWRLSDNSIFLNVLDEFKLHLIVTAPDDLNASLDAVINISVTPRNRPDVNSLCQIEISVPSVELSAKWLKVGSVDEGTLFYEGEMISIRSRVYNGGKLPAGPFEVCLNVMYSDSNSSLYTGVPILEKIFFYNNLKQKISKYPGVQWDTLGYYGNFTINVFVDSNNLQEEGSEVDNWLEQNITILSTEPESIDRFVLLKEVYYDTLLSGEPDEYITLYNPLNKPINISRWQLDDGEGIIAFPHDSVIPPYDAVVIADRGVEYEQIIGTPPDFEITSSHSAVPEMDVLDFGFKLTNTGDEILLRTQNRHIIDVVVYGNSDYSGEGWQGIPVQTVPEGQLLRRNFRDDAGEAHPLSDSNRSVDWFWLSETRPGQSEFSLTTFEGESNLTAFITPDCGLEPLIDLIRNAQISIDIASYTLTSDILLNELIEALERKVHIRILLAGELGNTETEQYEDLGTIPAREWNVVTQLFSKGAKVQFMIGNHELGVQSRYSAVNGKYIIADGRSVLVTSENFGWNAFADIPNYGNRGYGIIIENMELAKYLTEVFGYDWNNSRPDSTSFDPQHPLFEELDIEPITEEGKNSNESESPSDYGFDVLHTRQSVSMEPIIGPDNIFEKASVLDLLKSAETEISIALYKCDLNWSSTDGGFEITSPFVTAVIDAARAGVKVNILLDSNGFIPTLETGSGGFFKQGQAAGTNLEVLLYINKISVEEGLYGLLEAKIAYLDELGTLHGNLVIVDNRAVLISSFNWEFEMLRSNRELGLIISNTETARYFKSVFQSDWERSPGYLNDESQETYRVIITELYYDTYISSEPDEYIKLLNPSSIFADLSGWFLTDGEGILWLPNNTFLEPGGSLVITKSAYAFNSTFGYLPDFEFITNSERTVSDLKVLGGLFQLSNTGDECVVQDSNGNPVDSVIYGNSGYSGPGWKGSPVPDVSEGQILKRVRSESAGTFHDTDTRDDWLTSREYYPGQSQLPMKTFLINRTEYNKPGVTAFVSPDSSFKTVYNELAGARNSIIINVYQIDHPKLIDLLIEQSQNGVTVRILIEGDPVGGLSYTARRYAYELQQAGCSVRLMITDTTRDIHDRYAVNHAKYAVIDSHTVIIMSENWKRTGVPDDITAGNRGTGVVLRSPELAEYFIELFEADSSLNNSDIIEYNSVDPKYGLGEKNVSYDESNLSIDDDIEMITGPVRDYQPRFRSGNFYGTASITPVISPDHSLLEYGSVLEMLRSAQDSILIEQLQCYQFWNGDNGSYRNLFLESVLDAARRGCSVKILLDSAYEDKSSGINSNTRVVEYVNSVSEQEGLQANLRASLVHLGDSTGGNQLVKVHNKGIILDSRLVYVGSMNWGSGGPIRNREVGVIIEHTGIARYFEKVFYFDWNLTLSNYLETSTPYSNLLYFAQSENTLYSELGLLNRNRTENLTIDLEVNIYEMTGRDSELYLKVSLDDYRITIIPKNFTSVAIAITLNSATIDGDQEINKPHELWDFYDNEIIYLVELKASALNMTSTILWLEVYFQQDISLPREANITLSDDSDKWNVRQLEPNVVLAFVIITMIVIAVVRDTVKIRFK